MDLIKSGRYIDLFDAKTCETKISTVAGYHVELATLLFVIRTFMVAISATNGHTAKTINLTTLNFYTVNQHLSVSSTDKDVINQENKTGNDLE